MSTFVIEQDASKSIEGFVSEPPRARLPKRLPPERDIIADIKEHAATIGELRKRLDENADEVEKARPLAESGGKERLLELDSERKRQEGEAFLEGVEADTASIDAAIEAARKEFRKGEAARAAIEILEAESAEIKTEIKAATLKLNVACRSWLKLRMDDAKADIRKSVARLHKQGERLKALSFADMRHDGGGGGGEMLARGLELAILSIPRSLTEGVDRTSSKESSAELKSEIAKLKGEI